MENKLIQGNSLNYFKENGYRETKLILTSPSYYTDVSKKDLLEGEIGYGETKEKYVDQIFEVLKSASDWLVKDGKIVLVLGRYKEASIKSIIFMLEDRLSEIGISICDFTLHNKSDHEAIVVFNKGESKQIEIPTIYKLQIYDKVGFFGRINPDILNWAITTFTNEGELVIDPFAGAGSTVKTCKKLNRSSLGIELNPKFIERGII